jgi:hypothetical protein
MWTAVALTTVMSLAPAQGLELKNVRTTYGIMGEPRKDDKILPGDVIILAFDIEGLKAKDSGLVQYSMGMEFGKKGAAKPIYKREPSELEADNNLGGSLPAFAIYPVASDLAPGDYTFKVTVKDLAGKGEKTLEKTYEVVKPKLGFIRVRVTSATEPPVPVPPIAVPGQRILFHCSLAGVKLDKAGLPNVTFEMNILDDKGNPTVPKPYKGDIKAKLQDPAGIMHFLPRPLDLNRSGKFKIVIKATDNNSKETTEQTMNLTVLPNPE